MTFFARRRWIGVAVTLTALVGVRLWAERMENRLQSSSYFTGWLLLSAIVVLAAFQLRRKLPAAPFGSAATWLQAHIYLGLGSAGLYAIHAPWRWPNGILETTLSFVYLATFASGAIGLYWTRSLPRRLSRLGREVIYEQIGAERHRIQQRAQGVILSAVRTAGATTLGEFYNARLHDYFSTRRDWSFRLWPTSVLRKSLLAALTETTRYLSDDERKTAEQLFALLRERDDLDYSESLQWRLKAWLFVHIALTYPLLLAAGLHAWTAHLFNGGLP